jgi:EmrB/QacA subfamily drug resistance transporter
MSPLKLEVNPMSANSNPRRWWALGLLSVAQFLVILDTSIIGIALPKIDTALGFSSSSLQWVFNAYVIAFGGLLLLGGRLADLLGARRVFAAGFVVLVGGSLLAGLATSEALLISGRALQGTGAALVAPSAMAIVFRLFTDPKELGKAMGIWGASAPAGGTAGVFLGGVITQWISWRWTFLINVPIGLLVLTLVPSLLPRASGRRGRLDVAGAATITGAISLAVFAIVDANNAGWGSLRTLGLLAGAGVLLVAFLLVEQARREPLVRLAILRAPNVAAANLTMALFGAAWIPLWFFLNLYLQQVLGFAAFKSGAALLPMTLTVLVVMLGVTGRLIPRVGAKPLLIAGLAALAGGIALFARTPLGGSFTADVLGASLLAAVGVSLTYIPTLMTALAGVKPEEAGLASGLVSTSYQVGSALGLAIVTAMATSATGTGATLGALNHGYHVAFLGAAAMAATAAAVALVLIRRAPTAAVQEAAAEPRPHDTQRPRPAHAAECLNVAARMGRWSAQHRRKAVLAWLTFVVVAITLGATVGMRELSGTDSLTGESKTAQQILDQAGLADTASESVLIQSRSAAVSAPAFRAAVEDVLAAVRPQKHIANVRSPFQQGAAALVSSDHHSALVTFDVKGAMMERAMRVAPVLDVVAATERAHPAFRIEEFGGASLGKAAMDSAGRDFHRAEILSIPATLFILMLAFGAFVAAVLPVALALSAFLAAGGLVFATSHLFPIDQSTFSVMLLIGLAVGVDYSLFYIHREREERAAGRSADAALQAAAATSGRSVLISGLTVIVAVGGMFLAGTGGFRGIAVGTILVVATSVAGSLTVLPALLSKLGDRIENGQIRWLRRQPRTDGESRLWSAVLQPALRRPVIALVAGSAVLVALALPAVKLHTVQPTLTDYPKTLPIQASYADLQAAFPGGPMPAQVVIKARDIHSRQITAAIRRFRQATLASGQFRGPIPVHFVNEHVAVASVPLAGSGREAVSTSQLATLRTQLVPRTLAYTAGVEAVAVGGDTAGTSDYNDALRSHVPLVLAFVLGLAFLLLLVTFRSVVIPLKAIVLNLLSLGAAYGFLVAIFQWGWGESILGFDSTGGITSWVPLFLFVVLFGLSMDYHVFILSRIREAVDGGTNTKDAIAHGIRSTAGVVTSAAIVMVAVFSIFGTLSQVSMKQVGIGLAVAVLLDATIVRAVLLPTSMTLLGEWNWWLPRWLQWLPQLSVGEKPTTPSAPVDRERGDAKNRAPAAVDVPAHILGAEAS